MRTTSPSNATPGFGSRHGYRDLHVVDEVANRMIIAATSDCWFDVLAAAIG
jgi:hypothetical protein